MKLRILDNSIRLRLKRRELLELIRCGTLSRSLVFGGKRSLTYTIAGEHHTTSVAATFFDQEIRITIPVRTLEEWARSDQVAISAEQDIDGEPLRLLVEKDFACAHQDGSAADDSFSPHALAVVTSID